MSEPSNFKDVLRKNRNIILAILMMLVVGMTASIPTII